MPLDWVLCLTVVLGPYSVLMDSPQQPAECGGRFDTLKFQLLSPGFPEKFLQKENCVFEVFPASSLVCGLDIDFGNIVLPDCPSEWLVVGGRTICGPHNRVIHIPFLEPQTNITFKKRPNRDAAFNVTVQQIECTREDVGEECGGRFSEDTVVIQSPGYPLGYSDNLECHYSIVSSDPSVCKIEIAFSDSALESSPSCVKDSLIVGGYRMCGPLEGVLVLNMRNMFNIMFTSDSEINSKGFNMTIKQKRCQNSLSLTELLKQNEKQDIEEIQPQLQLGGTSLNLKEGYPIVEQPYPPFPPSTTWDDQYPPRGYLPPYKDQNIPLEEEPPIEPPFQQHSPTNLLYGCKLKSNAENFQHEILPSTGYLPTEFSEDEIAFIGKQNSVTVSPLVKNEARFRFEYERLPPADIISEPSLNVPPQSYKPYNTQQTLSFGNRLPLPSTMFSVPPSLQQCCGHIYSNNHFIIVSPNFPKTQSTNCIYTVSRFSPITIQLRLRFIYFLVGEETREGCSGGFLEIDGFRICGCKTGLLWTSQFVDSEPAIILHLKIDSSSNKLINGFVIEVFQDESYLQRFKRFSGDSGGYGKGGSFVNVNQYIETSVERNPIFLNSESYPWQGYSSSQPWRLQSDTDCVQWNIQDWPVLLKTTLLSKYQCTNNNDAIFATACRTCQYFCWQSCKCCQK